MPHYQTKSQRQYRYEMIAKAEGDQCLLCYIEKGIRRGPPRVKLIIEHSDNNRENWSWKNLHLACYSHNKILEKQNVREKMKLLASYSDHLERERERENLPTWTSVLKDLIPYDSGPPEMKAHNTFYKKWLTHVHSKLDQYGSYNKRELLKGGSKASGCSMQASRNYLDSNTSELGPFKEDLDGDGNQIIKYLD